jgi:hypothetical protein
MHSTWAFTHAMIYLNLYWRVIYRTLLAIKEYIDAVTGVLDKYRTGVRSEKICEAMRNKRKMRHIFGVPQRNSLLVSCSKSVRIVDLHWGNGTIPQLTLTLTTMTLRQLQNKQASRPLHVHTTMQPPSKHTVRKMYSYQCQSVK